MTNFGTICSRVKVLQADDDVVDDDDDRKVMSPI